MEANELRMFNAIKRFGQIVYVNEHTFEDVKINNGSYSPIELTEDWLLKRMGFKEVKPKAGIQKAFLYKGIRIEMSNSGNFYYKGVPKNKVHLIQNLTHALTNTELTINL